MKLFSTNNLIRHDLQAHIYSEALLNNVRNLKSLCSSDTKFCAVLKANAYGHGISEIANILKNTEIDFFAVASIYEAIHINLIAKKKSILILEPINPTTPLDMVALCAKKKFHCVIASPVSLDYIKKTLSGSKDILNLHVNIETGMGRCGVDPQQAIELINMIVDCPNTRPAGVYTHFATADEKDLTYAYQQLERFNEFLETNDLKNRKDLIIHAANSAACIKMSESHFDMVRCGISLYGYYSRSMENPPIKLEPILKLQAPIVQLKKIPAGSSVSYGRSFISDKDRLAAVIPLGYADGYWRCFSNKSKMMIGENEVSVIGRVCMDQLLVDVTSVENISLGQMVTIIDNRHDSPCGVYALAELADTICYEVLTCIHAHVNRIIH